MAQNPENVLPSTWQVIQNLGYYRQTHPHVVVGRAFGWADRFALVGCLPLLVTQGLWLRPLAFAGGVVVNYLFEHMGLPETGKPSLAKGVAGAIERYVSPKLFHTLGIVGVASVGVLSGLQQQDVAQHVNSAPLAIAGSLEALGNFFMAASLSARITHQSLAERGAGRIKNKKLYGAALLTDYVVANSSNAALMTIGALTILHTCLHNAPDSLAFWSECGGGAGLMMTGALFMLGCTTLLKEGLETVKEGLRTRGWPQRCR